VFQNPRRSPFSASHSPVSASLAATHNDAQRNPVGRPARSERRFDAQTSAHGKRVFGGVHQNFSRLNMTVIGGCSYTSSLLACANENSSGLALLVKGEAKSREPLCPEYR
jgi:hypothetical protein